MRTAFLHLSDIHFENSDKEYQSRVDKIANAVRTVGLFDDLFIVVTGDIAYSGQKNQYRNAKLFLSKLTIQLHRMFKLKAYPHVLLVPGNHDVVLPCDQDLNKKVQQSYMDNTVPVLFEKELERQKNFFEFAESYGYKKGECPVVIRDQYPFGEKTIEFILINTAVFSMHEQEKGLHYLPEQELEKACCESKADFVFYVMHHSYHWFNDAQKSCLEDEIHKSANAVFLGHEHHPSIQGIKHNENDNTLILAGGMLANRGNWNESEFAVYVLDADESESRWSGYTFRWDLKKKIYIEARSIKTQFSARSHWYSDILSPCSEFLNSLVFDEKMPIDIEMDKYFVFPRLEKQNAEYSIDDECLAFEDFQKRLLEEKKIIVFGPSNSGKTTLLKYLAKELMCDKVVVFCDCDDVNSGNRERIVRRKLQDIYGDSKEVYSAYRQLSKEQRILIIDDSHQISDRSRTEFFKCIEEEFEYIILTRNEYVSFNLEEQARMDTTGDYVRYSLSSFYMDKRDELIRRLTPVFSDSAEELDEVAQVICESLRRQKTISYFTPDIVCQFVQYYCKNIAEARQNDSGILGKVFEANLIKQIEPRANKITVDALFMLLDRVAYRIHSDKLYPIPEKMLIDEIEGYKQEYGAKFSTKNVLEAVLNSQIIRHDQESNTYYFSNKSHLAYFVAREIRRKYIDSRDTSDLQKVLNYCCFGINADILMMLTYITEDARMLDSLLEMALNCVNGWNEVSLDQKSIPLFSPNEESPVFQISGGNIKREQAAHEVSQEKKKTHLSEKTALKLYDYNESDVDLLGNQLARAMSLMVVVARCLPSFEHMMRANTKQRFVAAIYELPHRIFYRWATEMNMIVDDLVEQLYVLYSEANQNNPRVKVPSKDDLSSKIRSDALCQYLNILYAAVVYSTRANTIEFLNEYDYKSGSTYGIMHAMMLERRERIDELFKEMSELYEKNESPVVRYLIQRVMHHSVVFSKKMTKPQTQRIEEKFLDGGKGHQQRLVVRNKKR